MCFSLSYYGLLKLDLPLETSTVSWDAFNFIIKYWLLIPHPISSIGRDVETSCDYHSTIDLYLAYHF